MGTSVLNLNQNIELPPIQILFESLNRENEPRPYCEERRLQQLNPSFIPRTSIAVGSPVNPVPVSSPGQASLQNITQFPVIYKSPQVVPTSERDYVISVGRSPISSLPDYEHFSSSTYYQGQRRAQPYPVNATTMMGNYLTPQPIGISRGKLLSSNIDKKAAYTSSKELSVKEKRLKGHGKRSNLPKATVCILNQWLLEHIHNPYPTVQEKRDLLAKTGLTKLQISNWFINARRRKIFSGHNDVNNFKKKFNSSTDLPKL
ncbi:AIS_HP2_G0018190.mRNA.1.CDS.1 [Saccharomyces cerevisiae]|nr:AIS_HP2_G0018190.mRNA.1.CDS.1 [Saccharomyces cerevisiae]CAI6506135.1 AIS_HP2_G0018190.mRNA.1.CDS.1 [Saccharomyces cerevisiae]